MADQRSFRGGSMADLICASGKISLTHDGPDTDALSFPLAAVTGGI
jgi:hypothetical protein